MAVIRGVLAWAAIQRVTRVYHERKWFKAMKEIQDSEWKGQKTPPVASPASISPFGRPRSRRNTIRGRPGSAVHVVSDVRLPNNAGEILTAEIGEPSDAGLFAHRNYRLSTASLSRMSMASTTNGDMYSSYRDPSSPPAGMEEKPQVPYPVLRNALRRFSRMVLGGYGGLPVLFLGLQIPTATKKAAMEGNLGEAAKTLAFGQNLEDGASGNTATPSPTANGNRPFPSDEASRLEHVIDVADQVESDDDDDGSSAWNILEPPSPSNEEFHHNPSVAPEPPSYSWWNLLLGKHDEDVFHAFATSGDASATPKMTTSPLDEEAEAKLESEKKKSTKPTTTHAGVADRVPRFWVLTDHGRQQIVLVLRGTMSLNEVAIDLACDVAPFRPASAARAASGSASSSRSQSPDGTAPGSEGAFHVHAGMYALASAMAAPGKPVHEVVAKAMTENPDYELVLCGHSLGAGVASIIALMWADPNTCLTVRAGGLPENRPVSVFCFAPPCVFSPALSRACRSLITSFAYSNDMVTRLSKGSVRDMQRAANWLAYEQQRDPDSKESCGSIIRRAIMLQKGYKFMGMGVDPEAEEAWFWSLRTTLEAQMRYVDLFPPGRIFWAMRDSSFHPAFRRTPALVNPNAPRVFEVDKVEDVFGQIVFAPDMVISHLVHLYDQVLHDFL